MAWRGRALLMEKNPFLRLHLNGSFGLRADLSPKPLKSAFRTVNSNPKRHFEIIISGRDTKALLPRPAAKFQSAAKAPGQIPGKRDGGETVKESRERSNGAQFRTGGRATSAFAAIELYTLYLSRSSSGRREDGLEAVCVWAASRSILAAVLCAARSLARSCNIICLIRLHIPPTSDLWVKGKCSDAHAHTLKLKTLASHHWTKLPRPLTSDMQISERH